MPNEPTEYDLKLADELEAQCRSQGVHNLEPLAAVMQFLEDQNNEHGRAVIMAAGIWYHAKLVTGRQAGKGHEALAIDKTCEHLARLMRGDKRL